MARVLIVDDSSLGRKFVKRILLKADHEIVAEAENGEEGILEYKRVKPEIVTMDVDMPGINGLEASKRILKDYPEARIIIISAHEKNDLKVEMDKYGLRHCIIKPVTEENVKIAFHNALSDVHNKITIEAPNDVKADIASEIKAADIKVSVSYHSKINNFVVKKKGEEGKILSLEIEKETPLHDFIEEDPIVLGYKSNGVHMISLCEISNVNTVNRSLKVEIINSFPLKVETVYQNLPASMYIDFRVNSTRKRYPAIIKTFRLNEIVFESKVDFNYDEKVNFDIISKNNKLLPIDGKIISKTQRRENTEYLIKLDFSDYNMKKTYVTYLQELVISMESSIEGTGAEI